MNLPGLSIRRPLMIIMIILAMSMFGYVAWNNLPLDSMPNMDLPYITVQMVYPGAGPLEIEVNVIQPVEEQISTIAGIKNITSYCMENAGFMVLQFEDDVDPDLASIDVKDQIDRIIGDLPSDLRSPVITKYDPNDKPIYTFAVYGDMSPADLRTYVERNISDEFGRIRGVATVEVLGGREREIHVNINEDNMQAHGLSIFQIIPFLQSQNVTIPGGFVTGAAKEYTVKMEGEFTSLDQIRELNIPVYKDFGAHKANYRVELGSELATVEDAYKDVRNIARFNGNECVQVAISKSADANTVITVNEIIKTIEELRKDLPPGMVIETIQSRATFIENTIEDTYENIVMGIVLTSILLLIFLGDFRLAIIAAVTMPVSLIITMIGMDALGFSLNIVTMMALTISIGILVTNSIIVIENIVRHRNMGKKVAMAAEDGTNEIMTSIIASTLTNLAVFIPIASTTGITGSVFQSLGLTIVFATIASIFLSFTLVPLMASKLLKQKIITHTEETKYSPVDKVIHLLERIYERVLDKILRRRVVQFGIVGATLALLVFTMKVIAPQLGSEFIPMMDRGFIDIEIELPAGTPITRTEEIVAEVERRLSDTPHLIAVSSTLGGRTIKTGVQYATVQVEIAPENERDLTVVDIMNVIRPRFADIPDAQITLQVPRDDGASGDIVVEVFGRDLDTLVQFAERITEIMNDQAGLTDFGSSWRGLKPEILITPDRQRMEHFGLSPNISQSATIQMIGAMLRFSITGNDEAIFREDGEEYPIRVQLERQRLQTPSDVASLLIPTPRGMVRLDEIAIVEEVPSISAIMRKNRSRMVEISCNVTDGNPSQKINELDAIFSQIDMPSGYWYAFGGSEEMKEESNEQLGLAGGLAVALTLMLLIGMLESITMGIVIFLTIPLGLIGVVWFLFLTNSTISMISSLSIIMLIGIVVNNAILLIDYAHSERKKKGTSARVAIITAAGVKLKAILMANLAIIISMVPMALGLGSGGSFRAPFAITAIGGVIVSTVLTFFVIPILYIWTAPKITDENSN